MRKVESKYYLKIRSNDELCSFSFSKRASAQAQAKKCHNQKVTKHYGEVENRTPDLVHAKHALYQLSYIPRPFGVGCTRRIKIHKIFAIIVTFVLFAQVEVHFFPLAFHSTS